MFDINHLPRTLYVTTNAEKINHTWYDGHESINEKVQLVTVDEIEQADNTILFPKDYSTGEILILHPYEGSRYVSLSRLGDLENSKFIRFTEIAQLLGAEKYTIRSATKKSYTQTLTADGKLKVPAKADVTINIKKKDDFKEQMGFELEDDFKGFHIADNNDYEKALSLIREYNFEDEETLMSLVKTRNPRHSNIHHSRTVKCDITQELNKTLDIALSLAACKAFTFDSNVMTKLESRVEKMVEINFVFPKEEK